MVNYILAVDMAESQHRVWKDELLMATSPMADPSQKGIDIAEIKIYHVRVYADDEKKFLERLKTYNNMDHVDGGGFRSWNKNFNLVARFIRRALGLGNVPLTSNNCIRTNGHVLILSRSEDKKQDGREMR